jgi:hypothetical protein
MLTAVSTIGVLLAISLAPAPPDKPGYAQKDGLSLTVRLDKKSHGLADEVVLRFVLKNETDKVLFVADGSLAPGYHEAGPGRHFEVHVKAGGKESLYFWTGMATEGRTAGIRKVFKLGPGEQYKGAIRLSAGVEKDRKRAEQQHEQRGGTFESPVSRRSHVLGRDGRKYTVELRYQVDPESHGVWQPPADFKTGLLWKGKLTSAPLTFEVSDR